jgi:Tfp pilus assembly protein PilO
MKISAAQMMIAAVVLAFVVAGAAVFLLVVPQFAQLSDLESRRAGAEQTMSQTQSKLTQLEQVKRGASETQAQLIKISNEVPDSPELPTLVLEMQNAADSAGLDFQSIKPAEPIDVTGASYREIAIQMKLQGRWADVLDFLRRTQKMSRAVRMVSVELLPANTQGSVPTTPTPDTPIDLTANLALKVYVMALPSRPNTTAAPSVAPATP